MVYYSPVIGHFENHWGSLFLYRIGLATRLLDVTF